MTRPRQERLPFYRVLSHLVVMVAVAGVLGVVVAGLAIPFAGVVGLSAKGVARTMNELPADLDTGDLAQKTRILDSDGKLIATIYDPTGGNRINVPLAQISRTMVKSIVAIEDYRFYQHGALDLKGTLRALITNQANSGVVQGGSSITQQLVKLTLQDQAKTPAERKAATADTYARKLKELRYAIALEQKHTKDWILERYLNTAYFGDGAFGIQAAAQHYFNVNARSLNLQQSAMLAGLVKNPTGYDPTNSPDAAKERRNVVLDRMAQLDVITQQKADKTEAKKLGLHVQPSPNGCVDTLAPFFCDYVLRWLEESPDALPGTFQERKDLLYSGGLTIKTTIDLDYQSAADTAVSDHVYARDDAIGGMAMIQPRTGNVLALAQSRPMGSNKRRGQTYLNYTVPQEYGDSAGFQAGSTFKAFVLASAINDHVPLTQSYDAQHTMTFNQADYANCPDAPPFAGTWTVSNSTVDGYMDVYRGTQKSVNTFYAQLERRTGVCDPYNLAKAMGVDLTNPTGDSRGNGAERVPSFTLGVANVSPLEMAEAYATFGGRGLHCAARPVTSIEDSAGNVVKDFTPNCTQVMPEATADAVNSVLRGVQEPGGFGYDIGGTGLTVPSAGKTGTTQEGKSVWFMGYTPAVATSAMIAGANSLGTPISLAGVQVAGSYHDVSGSGFAGPMWAQAMHAIESTLPDEDFTPPAGVDVAGVPIEVTDTGGLGIQQAMDALEAQGFQTQVSGTPRPSRNPAGSVAETYPAAGQESYSGTTITIYPSTGKAKRGRGR